MWHDQQVSLYTNHWDKIGRPVPLREALFTWFAVPHVDDYGRTYQDFDTLAVLRKLDPTDTDYKIQKKKLKDTLQGFTPAGHLKLREHDNVIVEKRTGIISIDFDELEQYDMNEVKQAIGSLPFVGYCGLSASGKGLFALVLIAEPEKQFEYAEHLFEVFKHYGIPPDTTKGRRVNDLRYVSYDSNPVINDYPEPLRITHKKPKIQPKPATQQIYQSDERKKAKAVNSAVSNIAGAQVGQRWGIVQHWSYSLGGFGDKSLLEYVTNAIKTNTAFAGEELKYIKCAVECFEAGAKKLFA